MSTFTYRRGLRTATAILFTGVLAFSSPLAATAVPSEDEHDLRERIETLVDDHLGTTAPGVMVAVVDADSPVLSETWGVSNPATGAPLTPQTRTPVASVSKVVTALTALQLHHAGMLDLDADIRDALPVEDRRDALLDEPVTGRHLLTHHSGLAEALLLHPDPSTGSDETLLQALTEHPPQLARPSGAGLHYSPMQGYALLGAAIEEATGGSFDDAASEWVLEPVGAISADFDGPRPQEGDVQMSTRDGEGWALTDWLEVTERPSASLTWSTQDATELVHSLLSGAGLPEEVIAEAFEPEIRPAHGGGGHTQVFFESWRSDLPVLEHAGASGLAWLAIIPRADIGVFTAVTTEDPEAAELTDAIVDEVAQWAIDTGRASPAPMPEEGIPTIVPGWAAEVEPVAPVGTFQEQLFSDRGPEALLRSMTGQITVREAGENLVVGDRRLSPTSTPGRWCDERGCLSGVRTNDGSVLLLRSDGGMLQQTLTAAPWWTDLRFVASTIIGTILLLGVSIGGVLRSWWSRRHDRNAPRAVSRGTALAWSAVSLALILGTIGLLVSPMTADAAAYVHANSAAVWALRSGTAIQLGLGAVWLTLTVNRWPKLTTRRCVLAVSAALIGTAMSILLVSWALPST